MTTVFQALYTLSYVTADRVSAHLATVKQEKGASAVEYALLIGVLAAVIIAALVTFSGRIATLFGSINLTVPAAGS